MKLEDVKKLLPDSPEAKIYPLGFVYRYLIKKREEIVAFESIEMQKVQEGLRATEVRYHGKTSEISISIGVANVNKDKLTSPDELYRKVDTRLYEAKDSGKDRMVID